MWPPVSKKRVTISFRVSGATGTLVACQKRRRASRSGLSTSMVRSKRRFRASSKCLARLEAAKTITGEFSLLAPKPSISVNKALSVSSSARVLGPLVRLRPMASISSMKTMAGA